MGQDDIATLCELAATQSGCFSIDQVRELRISPGRLRGIEGAGVVHRLHPRVLHFVCCVVDDLTRIWAAALQVGPTAVVSHEAALCLHGVGRIPFQAVVTVPRESNHRFTAIRVHRNSDLRSSHLCEVAGLRATALERAVVDVTSVFGPSRLADLVDRLTITERRTSVGAISRAYRQVNRRGRRSIANLGLVLGDRGPSGPTPRSQLEVAVDALLSRTALPVASRETPLPSLDLRPGLVDRSWADARLILEIDGRSWHSREQSMAADRARDRAAGRVGWMTVRVLDEEVRDTPELVIDDLLAIHSSRRTELARVDFGGVVLSRSA